MSEQRHNDDSLSQNKCKSLYQHQFGLNNQYSNMVYQWTDKVVIITGAATGIGEAVVRCLMEESVKVNHFINSSIVGPIF